MELKYCISEHSTALSLGVSFTCLKLAEELVITGFKAKFVSLLVLEKLHSVQTQPRHSVK